MSYPGAVAPGYDYDDDGGVPSHAASAGATGVAASNVMANGAGLILVNAGRRSSADSRGNDATQIEMHIRRLSGSGSRPMDEPPLHPPDVPEYEEAGDGMYDHDGEPHEKLHEEDPYGQMGDGSYDADGLPMDATERHTGLKRVYWADENGLALYEVYYSDKLHYSPQYSYEETGGGGQCCVIM